MQLPPRIGLITLACRDVERRTRLLRDLGWPETPESDEHHRTFQCTNGVVIRAVRGGELGATLRPADGFRGFTRAVNLASFDEARRECETLHHIDGVELLEERTEAPWGGGFSWRDPEGNVWDVAFAEGTRIDDRGGLHFP